MRHALAVLPLLVAAACATPAPAPTIAAPAPFSFDPPRPEAPSVRRWLLLGPFEIDASAAATPAFLDEAAASPRAGERTAGHAWTEKRIGARLVDFRAALHGDDYCAAYAFTYLHAAEDSDAVLWLGADNQFRVLLDGRVIAESRARTWYGPDTFGLAVHLTRGAHRLLVRVENCGAEHHLWMRVAGPGGGAAANVAWSLDAADPEAGANALADPARLAPAELLALLPLDPSVRVGFDSESDVARLAVGQGYEDVCPMWRDVGGPEYGPHPGRHGVVGLHAAAPGTPERAYWKVHVPDGASILRLAASPEAHVHRGFADSILRVGVFDGELHWLRQVQLGPDPEPSPSKWVTVSEAIPASSQGRDVLVVVEAAAGGGETWRYEGVWLDEVEIVPAR